MKRATPNSAHIFSAVVATVCALIGVLIGSGLVIGIGVLGLIVIFLEVLNLGDM